MPKWATFQHYADRRPGWIKTYTELLDDEDYLELTPGERSLLHGIWLAYASSDGQLRLDARSLSARFRLRVTSLQLERLSHAGWIKVVASKPLALARSREEKETEKNPPTPQRGARKSKGRTTGFRFVRGSHSGTYVADPNGTDTPPYPVPKETR